MSKRKETVDACIKWASLVCVLTGALCTSLRIDPINIWFLNAGAFGYLVWAIRIKDLNLIIVNGGLLAIYVLGLFCK